MSRWGILLMAVALLLAPAQALAQTPSPTASPTGSPVPSPTASPGTTPAPRPTASATPTPTPLIVDDDAPSAGQFVVVRGTGCLPGEPVAFGFDRERLRPDANADPRGAFLSVLQVPIDTVPNLTYTLFAVCGTRQFSVAVDVAPQFRGDMTVAPESVGAGGTTILRGGGCRPGSDVRYFLDDTEIGPAGKADGNTQFNNEVRIPHGTRARVYAISARCGDHSAVDEITIEGNQVGQTPGGGVDTGIAALPGGPVAQAGGAGIAFLAAAAGAVPVVRRLRWRARGDG